MSATRALLDCENDNFCDIGRARSGSGPAAREGVIAVSRLFVLFVWVVIVALPLAEALARPQTVAP